MADKQARTTCRAKGSSLRNEVGAVEGDDDGRLFGGLLAQGCVLREQDGDDGSGCVDLALELLTLLPVVLELAAKVSDLLRLPLAVETCRALADVVVRSSADTVRR
ncbi:hypothetical protein ACFU9B_34685 [Streptomyces sp. NPDC057592]|uniref:hypothetical protein n=1 Tax=unclassified Streptomyces TaxID=2593676 RepID=UPI0036BD977A